MPTENVGSRYHRGVSPLWVHLCGRTRTGGRGCDEKLAKNRLDLGAESGRISPSQARRDFLRNQIIQRAALTDAERFIGSAARRRGNAGIQG